MPVKLMLTTNEKLLCLESTLQELTLYEAQIEPDCLGGEIIKIFEENPLLPGVIVAERGECVGLVCRQRFFECMSRPYSLELFSKRPIHILYQFTSTQALVFDSETSIVAAARHSLQRTPEHLYKAIVVRMPSGIYKLLDMHQLLLAQSQIHELTMLALRTSQEALYQEKELAQVTLHSIGDAVIATNSKGYIESLNPVAQKLTGWQAIEARGKPLTEVFRIINENTRSPVLNPIETVLREGRGVGLPNHTLLIARDGSQRAIDDSASPIRAKDGEVIGCVLVFRDVTSERSLTRQLSWQASHDTLTGLVNRREFEQRLSQALSSAKQQKRPHTLCYLDLDRFKLVNDTCGHVAGDELLRQVSALLQNQIRNTDVLARLGGDEFGLLLYQCPLEQARRIANALLDSIQKFRFAWQDKTFTIGVSIGLIAITAESPNGASVLSAADAACYAAKNTGRNRVYVYKSDDKELANQQHQTQWVERITKALAENQFRLYYQTMLDKLAASLTRP
jgi:diguanylate cyclase (GGDEF)-like protein/PAS domain S-box-containing protein